MRWDEDAPASPLRPKKASNPVRPQRSPEHGREHGVDPDPPRPPPPPEDPEEESEFAALQELVEKFRARGDLATAHDCIAQKLGEGAFSDLKRAALACTAASLRLQLGDPDGALDLYVQAMRVQQQDLGPDDLTTIMTAHEIASILAYVKAQPGTALELFKDIARRCEATLDGSHQDVTYAALMDLGCCYRDVGRTAEAISTLKRALDGYRGMLGPESAMTGRALAAIGDTYRRAGEHEAARRVLQEAAAVQQKAMEEAGEGPEAGGLALELAGTLKSLGFSAMCLRDGPAAIDAYARALDGYRTQLGGDHAAVLQAQDDYACALRDFGNSNDKALHLFSEVLEARVRMYGGGEADASRPAHPDVAWSFCYIGDTHVARRDYRAARDAYKRALAVASRALPAGDYRLAHFKQKIAACPEVVTGEMRSPFRAHAKARVDSRSPPRHAVGTPLSKTRWSAMVPQYASRHPASPPTRGTKSASSLHGQWQNYR